MNNRRLRPVRIMAFTLAILVSGGGLAAQNARPGTLRGQVTDPSGASVPQASVTLTTPTGQRVTRVTEANGTFEITDLAPGNYNVAVSKAGFSPSEQGVQITAGQVQQIEVALEVATQQEEVTVSEVAPTVDASPSNNADAVVMQGSDLDALSDDPDQLQADLQALAGPAAGPNGGQIFIDGFTGGELPPKSSIREIRINSNPFSAEFDRMGFGRIEILTRPGTDTLHGRLNLQGNSSAFNTKSPFVTSASQVPYHSINFEGNISGSMLKKLSYTFNVFRRSIDDSSIVNAIVLDQNLNQVPFNAGVPNPQTRTNLTPRIDYQISRNNTLTARYQYSRVYRPNVGVGGFALPSQGSIQFQTENNVQLSDTQILGETTVNETRFNYREGQNNQTAQTPAPTIRVTGAFTGGGSNQGSSTNTKDYELQNYTSLISGPHTVKFGVRARVNHNVDVSTNNFLGTFTFPSINAYQITAQGLAQNLTLPQIRANCAAAGISSRDCGPNQFTITAGTPQAVLTVMDTGVYVQDDWRVTPALTLSGGLRFETQTRVPDKADLAPRAGLAWALGSKSRPTVVRAGWGIFYDRFTEGNVLSLVRFNGLAQQQYIVSNPDFYPNIPALSALPVTTSPTIYSLASNYHSPYIIQAAASVERQITRIINFSVNFVNSRGVHQLILNNINAPLPGTVTAANPNGVRPLGNPSNIYQFQSAGSFEQNQLIHTINVRAGAKLSLFGNYTLGFAHQDTVTQGGGGFGGFGGGGGGGAPFPSDPYNLRADAGRASNDIRHRVNVGGTMALPWNLRLSPLISMQSGQPYNITLGQDVNGDSQFNDRPAFATSATLPANLVVTPLGNFDKAPAPGQAIIPINYGRGPSRVSVNMRLAKTFTFGAPTGGAGGQRNGGGPGPGQPGRGGFPGGFPGAGGGPGRGGFGAPGGNGRPGRYSLTFNVDARNVFNKVNLGNPVGNIGSPLFGVANSLAGGFYSEGAAVRRIDLSVAFAF